MISSDDSRYVHRVLTRDVAFSAHYFLDFCRTSSESRQTIRCEILNSYNDRWLHEHVFILQPQLFVMAA
jgi:hypothetical protein